VRIKGTAINAIAAATHRDATRVAIA